MRQRQDYVAKRAYELAASGVHISPITIVSALVDEGYPEAAELLNSEIIRADLRRVCTRHWKGSAVAPSASEAPEPPPKDAGDPENPAIRGKG